MYNIHVYMYIPAMLLSFLHLCLCEQKKEEKRRGEKGKERGGGEKKREVEER